MAADTYSEICRIVGIALATPADQRDKLLRDFVPHADALRQEVEQLVRIAETSIQEGHPFSDDQIRSARDDIEAMLDEGSRHLSSPTAATERLTDAGSVPAEAIGAFRLRRVLGRGGMGTVYEAAQDEPRRLVALKLLHPEMSKGPAAARFRREAEIVARLRHPAIAQVYATGNADDGRRFVAMELVRGSTITQHAASASLSHRERLELLGRICEGVEYAHSKGIVHRDLKPDNILIEANGSPKILDFGIARVTSDSTIMDSMVTHAGQILGTLSYMSPEQIAGKVDRVGPQADVYALGVIAYELLTGRLPLDVSGLALARAAQRIEQDEPPRLGTLNPRCRGDVEAIVSTCLEKEPSRRYASAGVLAADIRSFLEHRTITAKRSTPARRLAKYVRRNRVFVAASGIVIATLLAATGVSIRFAIHSQQAERATAQALDDIEQVAAFQSDQLAELDPAVMGDRIGELLRAEAREGLRIAGTGDAGIERALETLDAVLAETNLSDVAIGTLKTEIFEPTLRSIDERFADQPLVRARLLQTLSETLESVGIRDLAVAPGLLSWQIRRDVLGQDHPDTASALANVAIERDLDERLSTLTLHSGVHITRDDLLTELARAIVVLTAELGSDHVDVLSMRLRWNLYAVDCGDPGWQEVHSSLVQDTERALGADHRLTIGAKLQYGTLLGRCQSTAQGVPYVQGAADTAMRVLGQSDPVYQEAVQGLASMLWRLGRHEEAEPYARESVRLYDRYFGSAHLLSINARATLAVVLESQGRLDEAYGVLEAARRAALIEYKFGTLMEVIEHNLASVQYQRGAFDDAEAGFRRALNMRKQSLSHAHPFVIINAVHLGMALVDLGRLDDAETEIRWALDLAIEHFGVDHHVTAYARAQLARVDTHRGNYAVAEPGLQRSYGVLEAVHGAHHDRPTRVAGYLVELYDRWHAAEPHAGHDAAAELWRVRAAGRVPTEDEDEAGE